VIPLFLEALSQGRSPRIQGDGKQTRDFTFVRDVVQANLLASEAPGVSGQVYNIACGRRTSLLQLVEMLNQLLGTDIGPEFVAARPGDVKHSLADITQAREDLEYEPTMDMLTGLRRTIEWWKATRGLPEVAKIQSIAG
jgi:nucleoside-diphosphate-sugar epimerase